MCKNRVSQTGVWVFVASSCSACMQAVPPSPLPSCYAMTSSPFPPQPDPVALPWPDTNRPSYLFLCKRLEAGALYSTPNLTREWALLPELGKPEHSSPVCFFQHFRMVAVSVKSGSATRTLSYTRVQTLYWRSAFLSALKTLLSSLISG